MERFHSSKGQMNIGQHSCALHIEKKRKMDIIEYDLEKNKRSKMGKNIFCALVIAGLCFGREGASFLSFTPGARVIGLAQCFTAISDDATACYYNPAGLAFIAQPQVLSMNLSPPPGIAKAILWSITELAHPLFGQKIHSPIDPPRDGHLYRYFYTAAAFPFFSSHCVGIDINYYKYSIPQYYDDIEAYTYHPCYSLGLNYGLRFKNNFGLGASLKYIYESLPYTWGSARSFAFNGGLLFKSNFGFSFGGSLLNLGPPMKYEEAEAVLPLTARIGVSQSFLDLLLKVSENENGFFQKIDQYLHLLFTVERMIDLAGEIRYHKTTCGFEIKAFDFLSYRQGFVLAGKEEVSMWNYPKGISVDLKIAEFDITITNSNWYAGKWWIQSKFKPLENKPEFLKQNKLLDRIFLNLSCLTIPGGGQLYNGDRWRALPYLIASFFVADVILEGHTKPSWQDEAYNTVVMTLPILYVLSGVEANLSFEKRNNE